MAVRPPVQNKKERRVPIPHTKPRVGIFDVDQQSTEVGTNTRHKDARFTVSQWTCVLGHYFPNRTARDGNHNRVS